MLSKLSIIFQSCKIIDSDQLCKINCDKLFNKPINKHLNH
ncbi:protein of unknown function [Vibrio tapetis subsp. tapetis]|uniref:Uncharacterized protein n=1 Tax=Vibrio tapetis subsp. tapetis TaxID=1671868 RepID=A0A2N8ZDU9_9VIBR|nr:protein of unknown function [Vibrio tapetis subsp. tapetis]